MSDFGSNADFVTVLSDGGKPCTTLTVTGEVDAHNLAAFVIPVEQALAAGPLAVIVDLSGVDYFGSAALRGLLNTRARAAVAGVRMAVVHNDIIARVLEITDLRTLLDAHPTLEAARTAVGLCDATEHSLRYH